LGGLPGISKYKDGLPNELPGHITKKNKDGILNLKVHPMGVTNAQ